MRLRSCILTLLTASVVTARFWCGTPPPTEEQKQIVRTFQAHEEDARSRSLSLFSNSSIDINVYFHIVAEDDTKRGGQVSTDRINRQIDALNKAYKPHSIHFKQAGAYTNVLPEWADNCEEQEMSRKLRNGTYADLNVYIFPRIRCINSNYFPYGDVMGSNSEFPSDVVVGDRHYQRDGVHIRADTMPGGTQEDREDGMTLVHEVGHWLGLFHTFQGGCYGEGDLVDDTPPEDWATAVYDFSCDHVRDSCPGGGSDLVDNYMNYSPDSCITHFTPGQVVRMFSQWFAFRAPHQKD